MVQAQRQSVSQLRDQLASQGFVEQLLSIGGTQYSVWMKGCGDPTNPGTVSQFMQDNAGDRTALRLYVIDRNTRDIGVTREGFSEVRAISRISGLGERYGGAASEAREEYEREHPPATFREEAAATETHAEPVPVTQPPVVRAPAMAERVAAQVSTPGTPFRITYVPDPLGAKQYAVYHIDTNQLSSAQRREMSRINEEYLKNGAYANEGELPRDVQAFINSVPDSAWIRSGDQTRGTAFTFRSGLSVTSEETATYQAAIDLNQLSASQIREYEELLGRLRRYPNNPGNLDSVNEFLRSIPQNAVIRRPAQA